MMVRHQQREQRRDFWRTLPQQVHHPTAAEIGDPIEDWWVHGGRQRNANSDDEEHHLFKTLWQHLPMTFKQWNDSEHHTPVITDGLNRRLEQYTEFTLVTPECVKIRRVVTR